MGKFRYEEEKDVDDNAALKPPVTVEPPEEAVINFDTVDPSTLTREELQRGIRGALGRSRIPGERGSQGRETYKRLMSYQKQKYGNCIMPLSGPLRFCRV